MSKNKDELKRLQDLQNEVVGILVHMADGNPGAITAIEKMFEVDFERSAEVLGTLNALGIRGSHLWVCFKDICNQDAEAFMDLVLKDMGTTISKQLEDLPYVNDYKAP